MDCQHLSFSPSLGATRREKAEAVLGHGIVTKIIGFALYWLGAKRPAIAAELGIPEDSLRTAVRVFMRDGPAALEDRRRSHRPAGFLPPPPEVTRPSEVTLAVADGTVSVLFGGVASPLTIPSANRLQARVVLFSFVNSGLLLPRAAGEALGLSAVHVRNLAAQLANEDADALFDKRRGRQNEPVLTPEVKAEIVLQCCANAVTGRSTSSKAVAADIEERTSLVLPARTLRHCLAKLCLPKLARELPKLVGTIKKGSRP